MFDSMENKKKKPKSQVFLIDNANHIISSYDPIQIGNKFYNNGFHGIELPRSQELYKFLKNQLNLSIIKKKT